MIARGVMSPLEVLKKVFGFDSFRGEQGPVIDHILSGKSGLLLMPTGGGKSLTYQLPAVMLCPEGSKKTVVVISPLIALMQDQVFLAQKIGIKCDYISSTLTQGERETRYKKLGRGDYQLIYVTPERFRKAEFLQALATIHVPLLAVDEAHCISLWGHDFRPDYSKLGELRALLNNPPVLALTATATPPVQKDILKQLNIEHEKIFPGGIERENLNLNVHDLYGEESKLELLLKLRNEIHGPLIVYFSLISTLEKIANELKKVGIHFLKYHGQMAADQRKSSQKKFLESTGDILLATPAFGLGINKPNIRAVIHFEMPASLESYFQEVGRAGRDGLPAFGHLLFDADDVTIPMDFIKWSMPEPNFMYSVFKLLKENPLRYRQEGNDYLRQQLNFYNSRDFRVESSINQLERAGLIESEDNGKSWNIVNEWSNILFPQKDYEAQFKNQQMKLLTMAQWAQNESVCRLVSIYKYFGHLTVSDSCGRCDNCLRGFQ